MRQASIRDRVRTLEDFLRNGVRWDEKRNVYTLIYSKRELRNARRRAARLSKGIKWE